MASQNPYKFNFNAFSFSHTKPQSGVFLFCRIQVCIDEEISSCLGSYKEKECAENMSIHAGYDDFSEVSMSAANFQGDLRVNVFRVLRGPSSPSQRFPGPIFRALFAKVSCTIAVEEGLYLKYFKYQVSGNEASWNKGIADYG